MRRLRAKGDLAAAYLMLLGGTWRGAFRHVSISGTTVPLGGSGTQAFVFGPF